MASRGSVRKRCQCKDADGKAVKVCKKPHGSWGFVIDVDTGATGRRKQVRRSGFKTRVEATEAMTKELAALDRGTWVDDERVTVGEWLDRWLVRLQKVGRSPKTWLTTAGTSATSGNRSSASSG